MRLVTLFFAVLSLASCSSKTEVAETPADPKPTWVQSRPTSGMYYTGIGVAQKNPNTDYQRTARESALSDLASEIKVNVSSNSLLYTLEREYKFEQEFRETIKVTSDLDLEEFELIDTWEDADSYWVYYRLNKQSYADRQKEKKDAAQSLALDFYAKGLSAQNSMQFNTAVDSYLRGLQALESFWGESNNVDFQGNEILLDNALFTGLRDLLTDVRITAENELNLTWQNGFKTTAEILVTDATNNSPFEGVPLNYEYFGAYGRYRGKTATDADGRVQIAINEAEKDRTSNVLVTAVDTEFLFEPFRSDRFMRQLTESLRSAILKTPINYRPPGVYLDVEEKNLGEIMRTNPLSSAVKTSLLRKGFQFSDEKEGADLTVIIRSNTRKGGIEQGFHTAFLELDLSVRNNATQERVYHVSRSDLRGTDLDFERAGLKAYQNLTRSIESELMRRLVNDLF